MKSFFILLFLSISLLSCSPKDTGVKTYFCMSPNGPVNYVGATAQDGTHLGSRTVIFTDPGTGTTLEIPFSSCVLLTKR